MKIKDVMEWLQIADDDFDSAKLLNEAVRKHCEIICYHCAQSIEKYLKAYLISLDIVPKKTHDLALLNTLCAEEDTVRDIRSSFGYRDGEFATFAIDCGSAIFDSFIQNGQGYDYVLNLSALKHVRSEKDPFTLMRMIDVNIFNTDKTIQQAKGKGANKYFCVSTDKAANPVNMMGASKRIMEMFLMRGSLELPVSTARFANVAFSDGSLLYGFNRRMEKEQPLAAPNDVRRYFVTPSRIRGIMSYVLLAWRES